MGRKPDKNPIKFSTISAKEETVKKAGIIAACEDQKIYEIVEKALKCTYPKYFCIEA